MMRKPVIMHGCIIIKAINDSHMQWDSINTQNQGGQYVFANKP